MTARLSGFHIFGLFGLYSHKIEFKLRQRITIIIGPNGRGKTVCLKFIEALFHKRYTYFREIPFRSALFEFEGGETIRLDSLETIDSASEAIVNSVHFQFSSPNIAPCSWSPSLLSAVEYRQIRRYVPNQWREVSTGVWVDSTDGEQVPFSEIVRRYSVPAKIASTMEQNIPEQYSYLVDDIDCQLIETQRLLVLPAVREDPEDDFETFARVHRRQRGSRLAIEHKASKLKSILQATLASYANLSQSLDRSFPFRVFEAQGSTTLTQNELRAELKKLGTRREALMASGILDAASEPVTIPSGNIESGVAKALDIYVKDAFTKLEVFDDLRERIDLFKDIIESRFIDKTLRIDRESGFRIISKNNSEVPIDKLSSGEQHQLILVFDLLFEVSRNALILIDEPELSLHVAWQRTFIESLSKIISLNGFDVLLATHSPALIAKHMSLTSELGPVDL